MPWQISGDKMKATYIDHMGTDLTVVNAARVSFGKESAMELQHDPTTGYDFEVLGEKDTKLIKYLAGHGHYSPFGHCFASFHIKAPVFVRAQLVKHEYLRMNEVSRRYVDDAPEFYVPDKWREKAKDKKQGSSGVVEDDYQGYFQESYHDFLIQAKDNYCWMVECGAAPEMARMLLPQSTYTEWYWSGSLDAFANMYNLRKKPDAQEETRLIAEQIGGMMSGLYPESWKALTNGK